MHRGQAPSWQPELLALSSGNDMFSNYQGDIVRTFEPELTGLQRQVLALLGIPETVYHIVA